MSFQDHEFSNRREPSHSDDPMINEALGLLPAEIDRLLAPLDDLAKQVIKQRFGLEGNGEAKTLAETAATLGLSEEDVLAVERRAMSILRHPQ
jgi:DNA-directed RNA polymerase sigma subunit (sigma70/sigma32)